MISTSYSLSQSLRMLNILGKNKMPIMITGPWPEYLKDKYHEGSQFFFRNNGSLITRINHNEMITWTGPLPIDNFWTEKISKTLSFECARHLKSLQEKKSFPRLGHLICKYFKFEYLPTSLLKTK